MKLLTIAIPCYNSQEYMSHAIESALSGGEDVEVIIVNDGSKDDTAKIADEYEKKYPSMVKAVHQENGGHGEAVNAGLRNATGLYYKVLDSDDWLDEDALKKALAVLRQQVEEGTNLDVLLCNYVYERVHEGKQKVIDYKSAFPQDRVFTWEEVYRFKVSQNILMHSVIYRTKMLRDCGIELPKHTFYVDNIFVYYPLPFIKKLYYMDIDLYRYYIGRADQSVNEQVMIGRVDQQLKINKIMIQCHDLTKIKVKKLRNYMAQYLAMMMTVSTVFLLREGSEESLQKREELWEFLKNENKQLYKEVKNCLLGRTMQLRGKAGNKIIIWGYRMAQRFFGFN